MIQTNRIESIGLSQQTHNINTMQTKYIDQHLLSEIVHIVLNSIKWNKTVAGEYVRAWQCGIVIIIASSSFELGHATVTQRFDVKVKKKFNSNNNGTRFKLRLQVPNGIHHSKSDFFFDRNEINAINSSTVLNPIRIHGNPPSRME